MTDKCTNPKCEKELVHTEGRRPKKYCDVGCRNAHYKTLYEKPKSKKENDLEVMLKKDLAELGVCVYKQEGDEIKRIDPLSAEAIAAMYGVETFEMTPQEVKEKFGVDVRIEEQGEKIITLIPPHPKKEDYPDSMDYAFAKQEWKKKYNLQ